MTGQWVETPRESFMEAAQREMVAFERKEREFRKQERQERADQLKMAALKNEPQLGGRLENKRGRLTQVASQG